MFYKKLALSIFSLCISINLFAGPIINGDFSTCDYTGWQTDTDGLPGSPNDFLIENLEDCRAEIQVDYFTSTGDPFGIPSNDAFFANTLYQQLDFSGTIDSDWLLTFDYEVHSEITSVSPSFVADYFLFALNDGLGSFNGADGNAGFLVGPTDIDGLSSGSLSFVLSNSFTNSTGWSLDFQLNIGANLQGMTDFGGSSLLIDNVTLAEQKVAVVPEPSTLALLILAAIGIISRKKRHY